VTAAWCGLVLLCLVSRAATANAQSADQLWGTGTVTWFASDRLQLRVQSEPKAQLIVPEGQPTFFSVDTTPRAVFVVAPWIDVLGEIDFGTTNQSNEVNTTSVTPRVGVQLYILSRILSGGGGGGADREPQSRLRPDFRSLLRFEDQRQKASTDSAFSSSWTFRYRFRVAYPLNRPKITSSGAVYVATDSEMFVPLDEGFINQLRVRSGIGYRRSAPWRFETLYIWTGDRSRPSESIAVKNQALDVRVYFQF
jgi:hypothetical protein